MKSLSEPFFDPVCINFLDKFQNTFQHTDTTPLSEGQTRALTADVSFLRSDARYSNYPGAHFSALYEATKYAAAQFMGRARNDPNLDFEPHEIRFMRKLEASLVRMNFSTDSLSEPRRAELSYIFDCSSKTNPATKNPVYCAAAFMTLYMRPDNLLNRSPSAP